MEMSYRILEGRVILSMIRHSLDPWLVEVLTSVVLVVKLLLQKKLRAEIHFISKSSHLVKCFHCDDSGEVISGILAS